MHIYLNIIFGIFGSSYSLDVLDDKLNEVNGFGIQGYIENICIDYSNNYISSKEELW